MNDFVEQCRQEWKRLGVPGQLAEEMAADLVSDLRDAEAEGLSAEEYLGTSASDARSFATSWAAAKGIVPGSSERSASHRPRFLLPFTVLSAVILIVAGLLLLTGEPKVSLVGVRRTPLGGTGRQVVHSTSAAAPVEWILLVLAIVALAFATWLWSSWRRSRPAVAVASASR